MNSPASQSVISPSTEAWNPDDLRSDDSWRVRLDSQQVRELKTALEFYRQHFPARPGKADIPLSPEQFPLPGMADLLNRVQRGLEHNKGVFLLQQFPLDCSEDDARVMFGGLLTHIGWLQPQTIRGEYLQPVQDEGQAKLDERRGSKHNLGLPVHNDGCDVVAFLCRRTPATGGETILVSPAAVHNQMLSEHPEALRHLYGHYHNAWQDYMFPGGRNTENARQPRTWKAPIYSMTDGRICARYSRFYIDRAQEYPGVPAMSAEQMAALDTFDGYLYDEERWQYRRQFKPGDVLLINNHIVFHTRTAFEDGADPEQKRQLYRAWMAMPNSRPVSTELKDFFGNIEAGSPRRCCVKDEFMLDSRKN